MILVSLSYLKCKNSLRNLARIWQIHLTSFMRLDRGKRAMEANHLDFLANDEGHVLIDVRPSKLSESSRYRVKM